jgi:hypothetical protein
LLRKHLLLFDADQVLRDVDSGAMEKLMNQSATEKIAALEAGVKELRGQVLEAHNGPRSDLAKIDAIRAKLQERSRYSRKWKERERGGGGGGGGGGGEGRGIEHHVGGVYV